MSVVLPTIVCLAAYYAGYRFYARFLSRRIFALDPQRTTPATALEDGIDYVPTRRSVVFGHHVASNTGLAPMLGPAVAVIWGWLPALLMLATTLVAMVSSMAQFVAGGETLLLVVGGFLLALAIWLLVEAVIVLRSPERKQGLEIALSSAPVAPAAKAEPGAR